MTTEDTQDSRFSWGNASGAVGVVLAVAGVTELPIWFRLSCFALSSFLLLIWCFKLAAKVIWRGVIAAAICLFFGYVIVHLWPRGEAPKPLAQKQEPHISAELSVDSTIPKRTVFRVLLENVGAVSISSLRPFVHADSVSWIILTPSESTIAPHQKTELASGGLPVSMRPKQVNVYLLYESDQHEVHYSEFQFLVSDVVAGTQPILPTFTKEGIGDPLSQGIVTSSVMGTFQQNVGTLILLFPDTNANGSPNQILISAKSRTISVNSITHKAAVWTGLGRVEKTAETDLVRAPNGVYEIAVVWDDSKGTLAIQSGVSGHRVEAAPVHRSVTSGSKHPDGAPQKVQTPPPGSISAGDLLREIQQMTAKYTADHPGTNITKEELNSYFKEEFHAGRTPHLLAWGPRLHRRTDDLTNLSANPEPEPTYIPPQCPGRTTYARITITNSFIGTVDNGCTDYSDICMDRVVIGMATLTDGGADLAEIIKEVGTAAKENGGNVPMPKGDSAHGCSATPQAPTK